MFGRLWVNPRSSENLFENRGLGGEVTVNDLERISRDSVGGDGLQWKYGLGEGNRVSKLSDSASEP